MLQTNSPRATSNRAERSAPVRPMPALEWIATQAAHLADQMLTAKTNSATVADFGRLQAALNAAARRARRHVRREMKRTRRCGAYSAAGLNGRQAVARRLAAIARTGRTADGAAIDARAAS